MALTPAPDFTPVDGNPGVIESVDAMGKRIFARVGTAIKQLMYDELVVASGLMVANTPFKLFDSLSNKNALSTNALTQRRIPAGTIFRMERIGVRVLDTYGNTLSLGSDIKKILENSFLDFKVNSVQIGLGPLTHFPGGYGIFGFTMETGQSVLSNGIASESAPLGMLTPVIVNDQYDLIPVVVFGNRPYDGSSTMVNLTNSSYLSFELLGTQFIAATL